MSKAKRNALAVLFTAVALFMFAALLCLGFPMEEAKAESGEAAYGASVNTFTAEMPEGYLANNVSDAAAADGSSAEETVVANITRGGQTLEFFTVQGAIDAAQDGETIKIPSCSAITEEITVASGKNIKINLLSEVTLGGTFVNNGTVAIDISAGASSRYKPSVFDATITNNAGAELSIDINYAAIGPRYAELKGTVSNSGTLTLTGTGNCNAQITNATGGVLTVKSNLNVYDAITNSGTFTIANGTYNGNIVNNGGTIAIQGGNFTQEQKEAFGDYLAEGYRWTLSSTAGNFSAIAEESVVYTLTRDGAEYGFASLSAALTAADEGETIVLEKPYSIKTPNSTQKLNKSVTVDLNGKKISTQSRFEATTAGTDITVKNGSIVYTGNGSNATYVGFRVSGGASLTLDGVSVDWSSIDSGRAAEVGVSNTSAAGTLILKNGSVLKGGEVGVFLAGTKDADTENKTALCAEDSIIESVATASAGVMTNGSTYNTVIELVNTDVSGTLAIYQPSKNSILTIDGGTMRGNTGIEIRNGTLTVKGGAEIVATGEYKVSETPSSGGSTVSGAALAVTKYENDGTLTVNIEGGTFRAESENGVAFCERNPEAADGTHSPGNVPSVSITGGIFEGGVSAVNVQKFIEGGTFTADADLSDYLADGLTTNEDGTVVPDAQPNAVAKVTQADGTEYYERLADAFLAAKDGATIDILKDVTQADEAALAVGYYNGEGGVWLYIQDKSLTINGNGYTLTCTTAAWAMYIINDKDNDEAGQIETLTINDLTIDVTTQKVQSNAEGATSCSGIVLWHGETKLELNNVTVNTEACGVKNATALSVAGNGKDTTIDIQGGAFKAAQDTGYAFMANNPVQFTAEDTEFSGWAAIYLRCGKVASGSAALGTSDSVVTLKNTKLYGYGRYQGETNKFGVIVLNDGGITVNVIGGSVNLAPAEGAMKQSVVYYSTFSGADPSMSKVTFEDTDVTLTGSNTVFVWGTFNQNAGGDVTVAGGTFNFAVTENYLAEGYAPLLQADGTYAVVDREDAVAAGQAVAALTTEDIYGREVQVLYSTLQAAVNAAKEGDTVTLLADTKVNPQVTVSKAITIVLGGFTVEQTGTSQVFLIQASGVTITGDGATLRGQKVISVAAATDVLIEGVTIEGTSTGTENFDEAVRIYGSEVTLDNVKVDANKIGVRTWEGSKLTLTKSTVTSDYISVWALAGTEATIENSTINAKDVASCFYAIYAQGSVTVTGSVINSDYTGVQVNQGGSAVLSGTSVKVTYANGMGIAIGTGQSSSVTVKDSTIDATVQGGVGASVYGAYEEENNNGALQTAIGADQSTYTKFSVQNSTITAYYSALMGNGSRHGTVFEVTDSTLTSNQSVAVYHPQYGVMNVAGDTAITGASGIEMRAGKLAVEGESVTIEATAAFQEQADGSGSTLLGVAVGISQHMTDAPIDVTLNGGTYKAAEEGYAFYATDLQNENVQGVEASIEGGTFNGAVAVADVVADTVKNFVKGGTFSEALPAEYLAAECAQMSADGTFTVGTTESLVTEKKAVAVNAETAVAYTSLQEAFDAVEGEATITLLADIVYGKNEDIKAQYDGEYPIGDSYPQVYYSIGVGKTITLDMNGKTIDFRTASIGSTSGSLLLKNLGDLTITGNGKVLSSTIDVMVLIGVFEGASLTVESGTFDTSYAAIYMSQNAEANVLGGTFQSTCFTWFVSYIALEDGAALNIGKADTVGGPQFIAPENVATGGAFSVYAAGAPWKDGEENNTDGITVNIYDGTFGSPVGLYEDGCAVQANIYGGTFAEAVAWDMNAGEAITGSVVLGQFVDGEGKVVLNVTGGTFEGALVKLAEEGDIAISGTAAFANMPPFSYFKDGYAAVWNEDEQMYVTEEGVSFVAAVGENGYATLAEAVAKAAGSGEEVTLLANVTESIVIAAGQEIVLDLNGFTLTNAAGSHTVTNNGTLTIVGNGTVTNTAGGKAAVFNEGTATINGGTFTADAVAIAAAAYDGQSSSTTINGGTFTAGSHGSEAALYFFDYDGKSSVNVTITGGTFNGTYAIRTYQDSTADDTMSIQGGTFEGDIAMGDMTGFISGGLFKQQPAAEYMDPDYVAEYRDGFYVPVESSALYIAQKEARADVRMYAASLGVAWSDVVAAADPENASPYQAEAELVMNAYNAIAAAASEKLVAEAKLEAMGALDVLYAAIKAAEQQAAAELAEIKQGYITELQTLAKGSETQEEVVVPTATYLAINNAETAEEAEFYYNNAVKEIEDIRAYRTAIAGQADQLTELAETLEALNTSLFGTEGEGGAFNGLFGDIETAIKDAQNAIVNGAAGEEGTTSASLAGIQEYLEETIKDALDGITRTLEGATKDLTAIKGSIDGLDVSGQLAEDFQAVLDKIAAAQGAITGATEEGAGVSIADAVNEVNKATAAVVTGLREELVGTDGTRGKLGSLATAVGALQELLEDRDSGLEAIVAKIDAAKDAILGAASGDGGSATGLQAVLEAVNGVDEVTGKVLAAVQGLAAPESGVVAQIKGELKSMLEAIEGLTGALATSNAVAGVKQDIADAQAEIDKIVAAIGLLGTAEGNDLAAKIEQVVGSLAAVQGTVGSIAESVNASTTVEAVKGDAMTDIAAWLNEYLDDILGTAGEAGSGVAAVRAFTAETTEGDIYAKLAQAFSEDNAKLVLKYYNDALAAIDAATTVSEVTTAVSTFKAQVASVEAAAQNVTDVDLTGVYVLLAILVVAVAVVIVVMILKRRQQPAAQEAVQEAAPVQAQAAPEPVTREVAVTDDDKEQVVIAANVRSFSEAYVDLSQELRELFNKVRAYALGKENAVEVRQSTGVCVKRNGKQIVKLTVRRNAPVALFFLENEMLKDFRRESGSQSKLKVHATELILREEADLAAAYKMVDLSIEQIDKDIAAKKERAKELRRLRRQQKAEQSKKNGAES